MNTFGHTFRLTTFGESHGVAIGGIIDGCPAGFGPDFDAVSADLSRRRGDIRQGASARAIAEDDRVEWLSGLIDGTTLGTPIAFLVRNTAADSSDYEQLRNVFRPGHADLAYQLKYGIRDHRGGGRASARETVARVVAGSLAKQWLAKTGVSISARVTEVAGVTDAEQWQQLIAQAGREGDSVGGIVEGTISGLRAGTGEPVFDKLQARLAYAMMSIPAAKGFEYGEGFHEAQIRGSECNLLRDGIAGGISTGDDIRFRVAFKPTPSISMPQQMQVMQPDGTLLTQTIALKGRFDTCVAMRAPVIVEAMAALVLIDLML